MFKGSDDLIAVTFLGYGAVNPEEGSVGNTETFLNIYDVTQRQDHARAQALLLPVFHLCGRSLISTLST
jgi:hypothetical protein